MIEETPHLAVQGLGKSFGATRALDDVSVAIHAGTVHAFVGENGAGKSTLGKIIAGAIPPDQGAILLRGEPVRFASPREALDRRIAVVAQEVALVPHLTVAENVFLGAEPRRAGFIDRGRIAARFAALRQETGFDLPAEVRVGRLPLAKQQQVEILRALARDAELIILDEPSASLSAAEVERLHAIIRMLKAGGRTVVLVSHFLREVLELADTITVLRDGRLVATGPAADATEDSLIAAMLGRAMDRIYPARRPAAPDAPVVFQVDDLQAPGVRGVSFELRAGEIVGLAGLVGAGRTELVRAVYGAAPATVARLQVNGADVGNDPGDALRAGLVMIPESRKDDGVLLGRSVRENVSLSNLARLSRLGFVARGREGAAVRDALRHVASNSTTEQPAGTLSGGNQQKLLFARALLHRPVVLIADEPTRGVDVGAKRDLYALLVDLAGSGMAVLLVSNEMEEILGLSHRVLVMRRGRLVAELVGPAATESAILAAAFGTGAAAA